MKKTFGYFVLPLLIVGIALLGCDEPTLPPATSGGGFIFQTGISENGLPPFLVGGVTISGSWVKDLTGAQGNPASWTETTNALSLAAVPNGRSPATWNFSWLAGGESGCAGHTTNGDVDSDHILTIQCIIIQVNTVTVQTVPGSFNFSPNPLDTTNPPGAVTISGQGFNAQYGMPLVQYFDLNGNLVAQSNAQSIASDGSWIQAPTPDLSQIAAGTYAGFIKNANSSGGWDVVGAAVVTVVTPTPPPPPPDPGPCSSSPCLVQS